MAPRSARMALALLAATALGLSGCERGKTDHTASASNRSTGPSASPVPEPANLITPETLGKAPMVLKYGESASIRRGGVTITVTPGTVQKFDGTPKNGEKAIHNCGLWLALPVHVVIDAQPDAEWTGWADILYPSGLFSKDKHDLGAAVDGLTEEPDDIHANTAHTWHDWTVTGRKALHWDFTGKNYLTACKHSYMPDVPRQPDERPVIGLSWGVPMKSQHEEIHNPTSTLAVWFP